MERRYGDQVRIVYHNAEEDGVRADHGTLIDEMEARGLLYPITVVDGVPLYDGAVSYPAIMRAVQNKVADGTARAAEA